MIVLLTAAALAAMAYRHRADSDGPLYAGLAVLALLMLASHVAGC